MDAPTKILCLTLLQRPDPFLIYALRESNALCILELGLDENAARRALARLATLGVTRFGVRIAEDTPFDPAPLTVGAELIVAPRPGLSIAVRPKQQLLVQVISLEEAQAALAMGAAGVIAKGSESGGRIGEKSAFILCQQLVAHLPLSIYVQGGIGEYTAAACIAAGARGVVLDSSLALAPESSLNGSIKKIIAAMDGSETRVVGGHRLFSRADLAVAKMDEQSDATQITAHLGGDDLATQLLPLGQDAAMAKHLLKTHGDAARIVQAVERATLRVAFRTAAHHTLAPQSPFAVAHHIERPVGMGPMSRITDHPGFARCVAEAGGLPFLALSVLNGEKVRELTSATQELLGTRPWGVGLLGFLPTEIYTAQVQQLKNCRPYAAVIGGGSAAQAAELESMGITAFLHAPSRELLDMFLKEGARKFVFEGRECGGHIGPLSSYCLWETVIHRLLQHPAPEELHILFAGGIHDARSGAMIAALSAPLAERGVKIGVLMGTAYLFTREAVASGALMPAYQKQAIACTNTLELVTGPGHATRCAPSAYTAFFAGEKAAMKSRGLDARMIHLELEKLGLGRLRIAARGEAHNGTEITNVDEKSQLEQGMYSVGQLAALRENVGNVQQLHEEVCEGSRDFLQKFRLQVLEEGGGREPTDETSHVPLPLEVAIVGMACIYPDAANLDAYWQNVLSGKNLIREIPSDRWPVDTYYDPSATGPSAGDKTPSKWGGFIPETEVNPAEFGIPPKALLAIEPVQILALKVARDALKDAGYLERPFDRNRTAVFFGGSSGTDLAAAYGFRGLYPKLLGDIPPELDALLPKLSEDSFPGILTNIIAGRVSNRLDLRGASCTVDAACASSLAALNLAVKELITSSSDMVLCGGADLHTTIHDYLLFSSVHALATRDKCSPFDANADGTILGEGIGCLVLKRLDDARRDKDRIYAVIKGMGASSDGKSLAITAPSKEGQTEALRRAYSQAGVSPAQVGLIEAHGTGTVVGDKTELAALSEVFSAAGAPRGGCTLGSVKSQIGHTKAASGMAGLIKVAKAIYHGTLPPTAHVTKPNPYYKKEESPFVFRTLPAPWPHGERVAGVSSFGFGGANYHAVLAADESNKWPNRSPGAWPTELFLFRGATRAEAIEALDAITKFVSDNPECRLCDLAYTVSTASNKPVQFAALVQNHQDLLDKIRSATGKGAPAREMFFASAKATTASTGAWQKSLVFLLPGQGSQRPAMAHELFVFFPRLQRHLARTRDIFGGQLIDTLFPQTAFHADEIKRQTAALKDTRFAQAALGTVELAVAELLSIAGVTPGMLAGHSFGEITALCLGGAFDESDLLTITRSRIDCILQTLNQRDPGAMAAVTCPAEKLPELLGSRLDHETLAIANINAPDQVVITGQTAAVDEAVEQLNRDGIGAKRLTVACAFHSPALATAGEILHRKIAHLTFHAPHTPVWSNTTATMHTGGGEEMITAICRQVRQPVRFVEQIQAMHDAGGRIFVEVGPGNVLCGLTEKILAGRDHTVIPLEQGGESALHSFLRALARLATLGVPVDVMGLGVDRDLRQLDLAGASRNKKNDATLWVLDGHAAWPKTGEEPQGCLRRVPCLHLSVQADAGAAQEQSVTDYLVNMRQITKAQYEVMMRYLGASGGSLSDDAMVMPTHSPLKIMRTPAASPEGAPASQRLPASTAAVSPQPAAPATHDIKLLLLDIVSEKTGYPHDMLELDLDLEADLSIDSIKRIEILGALATQIGVNLTEGARGETASQASKHKTLRSIISFFEQQLRDSSPAKAPPAFSAALRQDGAEEGAATGVVQELSAARSDLLQDLTGLVQEIIAEKTGYPVEMLSPELDLEADLSIDSIKRIEILSILKNKLQLPVGDSAGDNAGSSIASARSIKDIVARLRSHLEQTDPRQIRTADTGTGDAGYALPNETPPALHRYRFFVSAVDPVPPEVARELRGQRFLLTRDARGVAPLLAELLKAQGATATISEASGSDELPDMKEYDMLLHLAPLDRGAAADGVACFAWIKKALNDLVGRILVGTSLGGLSEGQGGDEQVPAAGIMGMLQTVSLERGEVITRLVDVEPVMSPEAIARVMLLECACDESGREIGYRGGQRFTRVPAQAPRGTAAVSVALNKHSVIVATGGARGITARCLVELARRYGCHFEIVGRTSPHEGEDDEELKNAADLAAVRKILITRGHKKPAEIEALAHRTLAQMEIARTLGAIVEAGGSVRYHALDARESAPFAALIDEIYASHGTIDGFIHGAGILEDRFIKDKTIDSFTRVFTTKVAGAKVIATKARRDTKFVLFFSSVAGCFGNIGQVDYAAANDALDRIAWWLSRRIDGRCLSINWGPWNGTGMVTPELEREYAARGIGLIDMKEGMDAMLHELVEGSREDVQVVYMCADLQTLLTVGSPAKKPAA